MRQTMPCDTADHDSVFGALNIRAGPRSCGVSVHGPYYVCMLVGNVVIRSWSRAMAADFLVLFCSAQSFGLLVCMIAFVRT